MERPVYVRVVPELNALTVDSWTEIDLILCACHPPLLPYHEPLLNRNTLDEWRGDDVPSLRIAWAVIGYDFQVAAQNGIRCSILQYKIHRLVKRDFHP